MTTPPVSVVMSVYNGEVFLRDAIQSILAQTYKEFEFIIINDGSTDKSGEIIKSYDDSRIRLLEQENKGLVASLNRGIKEARGQLIARQDADDVSDPERLKQQVAAFHKNDNLVLLGSSMRVMDENSRVLHSHHVLLGNAELKQELLVRSPFAHGSTMFKRDAAVKAGLYNKEFWPAEDYDLWLRLCTFGDFANINEPLYTYRENSSGISLLNQKRQVKVANKIRHNAWGQRKLLIGTLSEGIDVEKYKGLDDGRLRAERITGNLAAARMRSIRSGDFRSALRLQKLMRSLNG